MLMSETPNIPKEADKVSGEAYSGQTQAKIKQLDENSVKKVLLSKRIKGMTTQRKIVWSVVIILLLAASGF